MKQLLLLCAWGNIDGIHISDCVHFMGKDCSIRDIRKKIPRRWKNLSICQPYQTIILKVQVSKYYIAKKSVFYVIHRPKWKTSLTLFFLLLLSRIRHDFISDELDIIWNYLFNDKLEKFIWWEEETKFHQLALSKNHTILQETILLYNLYDWLVYDLSSNVI